MNLKVSEHISLRHVKTQDAKPLFDIIDKHRDSLRTWLPFVDFSKQWEDTRDFVQSVLDKHPDEKEDLLVIENHGLVAGLIGFRSTDRANRRTEIGYWISPEHEGKGIVTLCCRELIDYCFRVKDFNRITIRCATGNARSSKIPKKLGFKLEGTEREGEYLNDRYADLEVYSLLRREWGRERNGQ